MKRAFTMVPDSFGTDATEDTERFGGVRADTLGHIAGARAKGEADNGRKGPLNLPNLTRLGLAKACESSTDFIPAGIDGDAEIIGTYTWAYEMSSGKDTPFGHWEIIGVPVLFGWGYFSDHEDSFPQEPLDELVEHTDLPGYLGSCHFSGTVILDQPDEEHIKIDKPIFCTSTDSVFQTACHEETFDLDKFYEPCEIVCEEPTNGGYNIGHVIARPFIGDKVGSFQHTGDRHDLTVEPPAPTVLQKLVSEKRGQMVSVGKTAGIYTNCDVTKKVKATGLDALSDAITKEVKGAGDNTIVFTNFVNFDFSWDHRYDVVDYAAGLELSDRRLLELMSLLRGDDTLIPTVDHGCDPTWIGTDHTREYILVLVYGLKIKPGSLGHREAFAGIGQTLAKYLGTSDIGYGKAMF